MPPPKSSPKQRKTSETKKKKRTPIANKHVFIPAITPLQTPINNFAKPCALVNTSQMAPRVLSTKTFLTHRERFTATGEAAISCRERALFPPLKPAKNSAPVPPSVKTAAAEHSAKPNPLSNCHAAKERPPTKIQLHTGNGWCRGVRGIASNRLKNRRKNSRPLGNRRKTRQSPIPCVARATLAFISAISDVNIGRSLDWRGPSGGCASALRGGIPRTGRHGVVKVSEPTAIFSRFPLHFRDKSPRCRDRRLERRPLQRRAKCQLAIRRISRAIGAPKIGASPGPRARPMSSRLLPISTFPATFPIFPDPFLFILSPLLLFLLPPHFPRDFPAEIPDSGNIFPFFLEKEQ